MSTLDVDAPGNARDLRIGRRRRWVTRATPYLFAGPAILVIVLVLAYPVLYGIQLSFYDTNLFGEETFAGFGTYAELFTSPAFANALVKSGILVGGTIWLGMLLSLVFAYVLDRAPRGGRTFRTIILIPYLISGIAAAIMWRFIFSSTNGLANPIMSGLGLEPLSWLGDPVLAMVVLVLANVWFIGPFATLILYAGLRTVDQTLYEAASIDGANAFHTFRHVTIPSIRPQIALAFIWLSFASFNMFDIILPLTGGGPSRSTEVLALLLYRIGFDQLNFNAAAGVMVVLLVINVGFSLFFLRLIPQDD